ncbi:SIS domain-containing protein [Pseudomonadota bacterium]
MTNDSNNALQARAQQIFQESAATKRAIADHDDLLANLVEMARIAAASINQGGKVMLCGNGGSAADAQHIAAELLVRLRADRDRDALPALTLAQDTSTLTACSNDYGFAHIFERPLRAMGRKGDVLIGITTSGNSENVVQAMLAAREMGIAVLGLLGGNGGKALGLCDVSFIPPGTTDTGRIQEAHITAGHTLVELIEDVLDAS